MTTTSNPVKAENQKGSTTENQKGIENHKEIASHCEAAAKNHLEAAKCHTEGNHEKAAQCTIKAQGHIHLASKGQRQDAKHHALNN
ncbi:MAG: hypothetical protein ABI199_09345 [Bacteroidia bacterium]